MELIVVYIVAVVRRAPATFLYSPPTPRLQVMRRHPGIYSGVAGHHPVLVFMHPRGYAAAIGQLLGTGTLRLTAVSA